MHKRPAWDEADVTNFSALLIARLKPPLPAQGDSLEPLFSGCDSRVQLLAESAERGTYVCMTQTHCVDFQQSEYTYIRDTAGARNTPTSV